MFKLESEQRCPICRGRKIDDNTECQRCNADLSLVLKTQEEANRLAHQGFKSMAEEDFSQSKKLLEKSQLLKYSKFNQQLLDFLAWRQSAQGS